MSSMFTNSMFMWMIFIKIGRWDWSLGICRSHAHSFNAHAVEHVENILCWNIAGRALSIWATSKASYCRIHHTDSQLREHTTETFRNLPAAVSSNITQEQRSLFCWTVLSRCSHVLQLFRRTVGSCLKDEWAQNVLQYSLVILFVGFNLKNHIITALFVRGEHWKRWTERFTCFWFSWLLTFL